MRDIIRQILKEESDDDRLLSHFKKKWDKEKDSGERPTFKHNEFKKLTEAKMLPKNKFAKVWLSQYNDLKKYNIDLNGVFGGGINNKEIEYDSHKKLVGTAKICLNNQLHFWLSKKNGDHSSMINSIEHNIKKASTICDRINNKT